MTETKVKKNQSVGRVFQIIELMAEAKGPLQLQDIALGLNMSASTVLRFLKTLEDHGYAAQDPETLKYSLTLKFCSLSNMVRSQISIIDAVRPYIKELSDKCNESTCLAIEQDMEVVYIYVVEGPTNMVRTLQYIGKRAPMHSTGVGKVLLTKYTDEDIDKYSTLKNLKGLTEYTITDINELKEELQNIRKQGYAFDNEECEIGAKCIAAPIYDFNGDLTAAISVSGPISRMNGRKLATIKKEILNTALLISKRLGYSGENYQD